MADEADTGEASELTTARPGVFHVNDKILWPAPVEIEMFPQPVQVLALKPR
jgi:hypothetical protein